VSSWRPRHLPGDIEREFRCAEYVLWRHDAAPVQHHVKDLAQFSEMGGVVVGQNQQRMLRASSRRPVSYRVGSPCISVLRVAQQVWPFVRVRSGV
jgi:hypothetical protein